MVDFNKLVSLVTGSGVGAGLAGGVAGGALVSALTSKSGRKAAKSVAQIGGLAAVGALAWNAYKKYQGDGGAALAGVGDPRGSAPSGWRALWYGSSYRRNNLPPSGRTRAAPRVCWCCGQ